MLKSLIIAFSTYSKISMPKIEWNEKNMRGVLCFFPLVGAVVGALQYAAFYLLGHILVLPCGASAAVLTALPVVVTGGIHMDGLLDTVDAKSSYRLREERLKILKDPHTGAFAVLYGCLYFILTYGFWQAFFAKQLSEGACCRGMLVLAFSYVLIRAESGISVIVFRKAKADGMLAETAKASKRHVLWVLALIGVACIGGMLWIHLLYGAVAVGTSLVVFGYYRLMSYRVFGGVTGDLAGYFLQSAELWVLVALTVAAYIG